MRMGRDCGWRDWGEREEQQGFPAFPCNPVNHAVTWRKGEGKRTGRASTRRS